MHIVIPGLLSISSEPTFWRSISGSHQVLHAHFSYAAGVHKVNVLKQGILLLHYKHEIPACNNPADMRRVCGISLSGIRLRFLSIDVLLSIFILPILLSLLLVRALLLSPLLFQLSVFRQTSLIRDRFLLGSAIKAAPLL